MISPNDVEVFMQKIAEILPGPTVDAERPAPSATGAPPKGIVGRVGGWASRQGPMNLLNYGMMGYGVYQGAKGAWSRYDQAKDVEKQIASEIGQYNTLTKKHPWNSINDRPETKYQKDTKEHGVNEANLRALDQEIRDDMFSKKPQSSTPKSTSGDLTMRGALQRDRSRYSRS